MPAWLIWLIVIVVAVAVIAAVVALTSKRRTEGRRVRAEELRGEASSQAAVLPESGRQAEELRAKADLARAEATRAEERAANAEQGHRIEQASYETTSVYGFGHPLYYDNVIKSLRGEAR